MRRQQYLTQNREQGVELLSTWLEPLGYLFLQDPSKRVSQVLIDISPSCILQHPLLSEPDPAPKFRHQRRPREGVKYRQTDSVWPPTLIRLTLPSICSLRLIHDAPQRDRAPPAAWYFLLA